MKLLGFFACMILLEATVVLRGCDAPSSSPGSALSVATVLRFVAEACLMYATWIGHSWARTTLAVLTLSGAALGVFVAWSEASVAASLLSALFGALGVMLLVSRDVRAYAELEKFPARFDRD